MRMPRSIPVNCGCKVKVIDVRGPKTLYNFSITGGTDWQHNPKAEVIDRNQILGASGVVLDYLFEGLVYMRVQHEDGSIGIYRHEELEFEDQRLYLPDCKDCGCFAVSHVPRQHTKMKIKCLSCRKCEGYVHPEVPSYSEIDRNVFYDPERGHFEQIEPED